MYPESMKKAFIDGIIHMPLNILSLILLLVISMVAPVIYLVLLHAGWI
jgi:hypothetical protein